MFKGPAGRRIDLGWKIISYKKYVHIISRVYTRLKVTRKESLTPNYQVMVVVRVFWWKGAFRLLLGRVTPNSGYQVLSVILNLLFLRVIEIFWPLERRN